MGVCLIVDEGIRGRSIWEVLLRLRCVQGNSGWDSDVSSEQRQRGWSMRPHPRRRRTRGMRRLRQLRAGHWPGHRSTDHAYDFQHETVGPRRQRPLEKRSLPSRLNGTRAPWRLYTITNRDSTEAECLFEYINVFYTVSNIWHQCISAAECIAAIALTYLESPFHVRCLCPGACLLALIVKMLISDHGLICSAYNCTVYRVVQKSKPWQAGLVSYLHGMCKKTSILCHQQNSAFVTEQSCSKVSKYSVLPHKVVDWCQRLNLQLYTPK